MESHATLAVDRLGTVCEVWGLCYGLFEPGKVLWEHTDSEAVELFVLRVTRGCRQEVRAIFRSELQRHPVHMVGYPVHDERMSVSVWLGDPRWLDLTVRQREICRKLPDRDRAGIAAELGLTVDGVNGHVHRISRELGLRGLPLARWCEANRIFTESEIFSHR